MKILRGVCVAFLVATNACQAFSLLGPYEDWMRTTNGFHQPGDIGGPKNLETEYRWNVPVITYAFDQSFLDYFGANGVTAVEQAIQILNTLPPASQLNATNYPAETMRVNSLAAALNLTDLKSKTLAVLLEQLGLAQATRCTFNMRNFGVNNGILLGPTNIRNFDALNFSPTNRVNDSEYDYTIQIITNGQTISVTTEEFLIDPFDIFQPAVADNALVFGGFYTGLTRDDVGGLRYLLHTNNSNFEILLPGVHGIGTNAGTYVDQAVRCGVDKITFVRPTYDSLLGVFSQPFTNQFMDHYFTDIVAMGQQLERVITEPDILFSAGNNNQDIVSVAQITRPETTNWWSGAEFGPGLIRPPIKLTFSKPVELYITWDSLPNSADGYANYWGSFDGSTNAPIAYPFGAGGGDLILNLHLKRNAVVIGNVSWQITLAPQESVVVLTSTNLVDWTFHSLFAAGKTVEWSHYCSDSQRYFRIVPN